MCKSLLVPLLAACMLLILLTATGKSTPPATPPMERESPLSVGIILSTLALDDGWTQAQYEGFESLRDTMEVNLLYAENTSDQDDSVKYAVDGLVEAGAKVIFVTSYDYGRYMQDCALKYPDVMFYHAGGVKTAPNLATVWGRMYQARYLTGIAAGLQTKTNQLGYVASYPIPEVIRGINAFTLGARSVNPKAVVHVVWTGRWSDEAIETAAVQRLFDRYPIDVLSQHQNTPTPVKVVDGMKKPGVCAIGYNTDSSAAYPNTVLTAPVWDWGSFYRSRLENYLIGQFTEKRYFDGLETGIIDIAPLASFAAPGTAEAIESSRRRMLEGSWDVFYGPIRDNTGVLRVAEGETLPDSYLLEKLDWYVQGVEVDAP